MSAQGQPAPVPGREEVRPAGAGGALLRLDWYKYCERGPSYHTPAHVMNFHEWYHVVRGAARVLVGGREFHLNPGQSVLFSPGVVRELFAGRRPPAYFATTFEPHGGLDLSSICDRVLDLTPDLESDVRALASAARNPQPDDELFVQALLAKIFIAFKRARGEETSAHKQERPPSALNRNFNREVVERVERLLRQHYHEPISRADIAEAVQLSPGHLARLYRAVAGQTLHDRITQLRLEAAKALLLNSTHSITQIALEVGYASFSHFSNMFKELEGVSPGDYRRSAGLSWQDTASSPLNSSRK